jgi:hypothetical protein
VDRHIVDKVFRGQFLAASRSEIALRDLVGLFVDRKEWLLCIRFIFLQREYQASYEGVLSENRP